LFGQQQPEHHGHSGGGADEVPLQGRLQATAREAREEEGEVDDQHRERDAPERVRQRPVDGGQGGRGVDEARAGDQRAEAARRAARPDVDADRDVPREQQRLRHPEHLRVRNERALPDEPAGKDRR
jgi:hypothetical protein